MRHFYFNMTHFYKYIQLNLSKTATEKEHQKLVFNTDYRLMRVKSIAECSKGSTLQYFRPISSYHFPLRTLLC